MTVAGRLNEIYLYLKFDCPEGRRTQPSWGARNYSNYKDALSFSLTGRRPSVFRPAALACDKASRDGATVRGAPGAVERTALHITDTSKVLTSMRWENMNVMRMLRDT